MRIKLTFLCLMLLVALSANVQGAHVYWAGYSTDFSDPLNWSTGLYPGGADQACISSAYPDFVTTSDATFPGLYPTTPIGELWMSGNGGQSSLTQTSGQLDVNYWAVIGQGYGGNPDAGPGGTATYTMSGNAVLNQVVAAGGELHVGEGNSATAVTTGTLNMYDNAAINWQQNIRIGVGIGGSIVAAGNGTLNMNGGTITRTGWGSLSVGYQNSIGILNQNAGTSINVYDPAFATGWGRFWDSHVFIGQWGAELNGDPLHQGHGEYHLNGGLLKTASIAVMWWGTGSLYMNGGTIQAAHNEPDFFWKDGGTGVLNLIVQQGGAVFDTAGNNIGSFLPLVDGGGGGGLTKKGAGNLALNAVNTYTGLTTVEGGTLGGSGTIGNVLVKSGAGLSPGHDAGFYVGNANDGNAGAFGRGYVLTTLNATFEDATALNVGLEATTVCDALHSTAITLGLNDALNVSLLDSYVPVMGDTFDIMDGPLSGTFASVILPPLSPGLAWDYNVDPLHTQLYSNGTLTVVPEPATIVLLLMGALMLYWRRQR